MATGWTTSAMRSRALWLTAAVAVMCIVVGVINPAFVEVHGLLGRLATIAPVVILTVGVGLVVLTGEIDISVGAMYGTLAAVLGVLSSPTHADWPWWAAALTVIGAGAAAGLVNGVLTVVGRVPSIVTTLGTMSVLRGVTEVILGGEWVTDVPGALRRIGTGDVLGVPWPVVAAAAAVAGGAVLTRGTRTGMRLYATGDNAAAAGYARISTGMVRIGAFVMSGALVGVAVIVGSTQLSVVESNLGQGYELAAVTAVVVGGVSIRGGRGSIAGVAAAGVLLGLIGSVLVFLKLGQSAEYWARAINGVCILGAVVSDRWAAGGRAQGAHDEAQGHGWKPILIVLVGLMAAAWQLSPEFVTLEVQRSLLPQLAEIGLLAVAMTMVILTGGIDLSVGSTMALAAVTAGLLHERGAAGLECAAAAVVVGAACGWLNGLLVTRGRVHPLVVTLATLALYRGVAEGISGARPISGFEKGWVALGSAEWLGIPAVLAPAIIAAITAAFALWRTTPGMRLRAIGVNETAARYCGLPVDRLKTMAYTMSGTAAGVAACLYIARRNTAKADVALGIELEVITACVLGGVSLSGGRGGIAGVAVGVLLLHELRQLVAWKWSHDELILIVLGCVLIASVLAGRFAWRKR